MEIFTGESGRIVGITLLCAAMIDLLLAFWILPKKVPKENAANLKLLQMSLVPMALAFAAAGVYLLKGGV